jgi:hypothetical protein
MANGSGGSWEDYAASQGMGGVTGTVFPVQKRVVYGYGNNLSDEEKQTIFTQIARTGAPSDPKAGSTYSGQYLVDQNRLIARKPYSEQDIVDELYGMDDAKRSSILTLLYSRGFYDSGKPSSTGIRRSDQTAFGNFLDFANFKGYTYEPLLAEVTALPVTNGGGGGAGYRAPAAEDVTSYLRQASLEKLGRTMTKEDVDKAVAAIQSDAVKRGPDAPQLSVAAEQQVLETDPNRAKSVKYRRAIDVAMNLLGA